MLPFSVVLVVSLLVWALGVTFIPWEDDAADDGWELRSYPEGDYWERFVGTPPAPGVSYRVLREEWDADYTRRTILEWELA